MFGKKKGAKFAYTGSISELCCSPPFFPTVQLWPISVSPSLYFFAAGSSCNLMPRL